VSADHARLKELKIDSIRVGQRHRRDMGDLTALAESIRQEGLLQPVGVTDRLELVFGERRLLACRDILKKKTVLARTVDVSSILAGEYHENEVRKDFTASERVAIARAIERRVGNRQGQRTDRLRGKIPEVAPGKRTREAAAEKAGFGNDKTYRQAAKVVESGTPRLVRAMDKGRVSIAAASILAGADAQSKSDAALRTMPSGQHYRGSRIGDTVTERGGSTPFNLLPVAAGASAAPDIGHPATTPYDLAAWWCKYLLPQGGVLLDCFCGSGTMLCAGLDFGASKVIGIERQKKYVKTAEKRVVGG
jgi:hypothetical protein